MTTAQKFAAKYIKPRNKYGAKRTEVDGIVFDSKHEATRWCELQMLAKAGEITDLRRQVVYNLIPKQFEDTDDVYKTGSHKGEHKQVMLERAVDYIADFQYRLKDGTLVVEDAKGCSNTADPAYRIFTIKRKLMLWIHGIKVKEV